MKRFLLASLVACTTPFILSAQTPTTDTNVQVIETKIEYPMRDGRSRSGVRSCSGNQGHRRWKDILDGRGKAEKRAFGARHIQGPSRPGGAITKATNTTAGMS